MSDVIVSGVTRYSVYFKSCSIRERTEEKTTRRWPQMKVSLVKISSYFFSCIVVGGMSLRCGCRYCCCFILNLTKIILSHLTVPCSLWVSVLVPKRLFLLCILYYIFFWFPLCSFRTIRLSVRALLTLQLIWHDIFFSASSFSVSPLKVYISRSFFFDSQTDTATNSTAYSGAQSDERVKRVERAGDWSALYRTNGDTQKHALLRAWL